MPFMFLKKKKLLINLREKTSTTKTVVGVNGTQLNREFSADFIAIYRIFGTRERQITANACYFAKSVFIVKDVIFIRFQCLLRGRQVSMSRKETIKQIHDPIGI